MVSILYEAHPTMQTAIKRAVLALDRGEYPLSESDMFAAIDHGYAETEGTGEAGFDLFLNEKGQKAARRWRRDDDHGGNAA